MTKMKKVALVMLLVLICSVSMVFAQSMKERTNLNVIYTNDVHCGYKGDIGYAGLAAYINELKATNAYVTVVDNGDAVQGDAIGTVSKGEYLIDIMNAVGYDFATFGNHEFDYAMDQLANLVSKSKAEYLACNFTYTGKGTNKFPTVKPYKILTYGNKKVAYIGVVTPESYVKSTPTYFMEDGVFAYEIPTGEALYAQVQSTVNEVKAKGADYVIVMSHLGQEEESEPNRSTDLIANTTGIDVVLDGHSHTVAEQEIYKNKDGKDVVYSQTGTKLAHVGVLTINLNDGTISTKFVEPTEKDPEVEALIAKIDEEYEALILAEVATSKVDLLSKREDGTRAVRNRETALGDFGADAYRIMGNADIGFINGGGLRADLKKGSICRKDIISVFPYGNNLTVVEATGQEILDALEWGERTIQSVASKDGKAIGENGGFLQVSGLKFTVDTSIADPCVKDEKGRFVAVNGTRRVKDVMVGTDETGYKPIDPKATYTLACHDYKLKNEGDGFTMFSDNKLVADAVMIDNLMLITYITDYLGGVIGEEYAQPQGRITII